MKSLMLTCLIVLGGGVTSAFISAQQPEPSAPAADYEELPELRASEILQPEILQDAHHKVREEVPTYSGANHYTIDSEFGVFDAEGNEMLLKRINEINAIARLKEVSRTDEFKSALANAAKRPAAAAKAIITDPVKAVTNVPKGVMKFMGRIGESAKNVGKKSEGKDPESSQLQQMIGFSNAKRNVAISLGVDPYSTNTVLQRELDGIAWASFAGGASFTLVTMPIGGGAGAALTATEISGNLSDMLKEKSPADLEVINRKALVDMGASEKDAKKFLSNNSFSPSAQTAFVLSLKSLKGVANRASFIRLAADTCSSEADAIFCGETAVLMAGLHQGGIPLARIETLGEFPICVAKDGTTVIALQWDYAAWTPGAARVNREIQIFANQPPRNKKVLVAVSGDVSPRLRQELGAMNEEVKDRLAAGPLK